MLPVPLVARMVLSAKDGGALSEMEIKSQVGAQVEQLQARGAHVYVPRSDWTRSGAGTAHADAWHLVNESAGIRGTRVKTHCELLRALNELCSLCLYSPA